MKNTRRFLSLLISGALTVGGIAPVNSVLAAEDEKKGIQFSEGFEEWEEGVIKDTPGSYTVGNLRFDLQENDKLEIAKNAYGNKALKITKGSTSDNTIRYVFPKQYRGNVEVSFDFLSEHNTRNFKEFANLEYNTLPNTLYKYTHFQNHLYAGQNTSGGKMLNAFSSTAHKGYVKFTTSYNTVGNDSKTVNIGYERKKISAGSDNIAEKVSYSVNSATGKVPEAIYGIRWVLGTRAGYDGTDAAAAGDTINAGVYWIDNIVVNNDTPMLSATDASVSEDFDSYTGDIVQKGEAISRQKYLNLNLKSGDSVSIETDPVTNSKALRIEKGTSGSDSYIDFDMGEAENKMVKLSFDMRFENHSRTFMGLPAFIDSSNTSQKQTVSYLNDLYWNTVGSANGGVFVADEMRNANAKNEYSKFEYTLDLQNGKISANIASSSVVLKNVATNNSVTSLKTVRFALRNFAAWNGSDNDSTADNNGVYWIDNVCLEFVKLKLTNSSIKNGETKVPTSRNFELTFNEAVKSDSTDSILVTKNDEDILEPDVDYTAEISKDGKKIIIKPISGNWESETNYSVLVGELLGAQDIEKYAGTTISFTTDKYSTIVLDDTFDTYTIGQSWKGPGTFTTGNMTFRLSDGDSVEYAYDETTGLNGFKLTKSNTDGDLDFVYSFPTTLTNGKYMVKVDERVQNHSKGHRRWPALLSGSVSGEIQRMGLRASSYWLHQTGSIGVDRYGVDHSSNSTSRYISGSTGNARTVVFGELSTGLGLRYGLYVPETDSYISSVEPAVNTETLGGVLMRMTSGGADNVSDCYQKGTQVDADTVNNPNNFGIAWIYGVSVEKIELGVKSTSFDNKETISPDDSLSMTFNELLDEKTVNTNNIELYEGSEKISGYEYTINLSADKKTVTVNPVAGLKFGTKYTIKVSTDVKAYDAMVASLKKALTYVVKTEDYTGTSAPDIVWSTLPNGIKNVDYTTDSVILKTDSVYIDAATINKDNIKVFENGASFDDYTVEASGLYGIKINLGALKKNSVYRIEVAGLLSGGENQLAMSAPYTTEFSTRDDIYADNIVTALSADGTKTSISCELFNETEDEISYQAIAKLTDAEGKILEIVKGEDGNVSAKNAAKIDIEFAQNINAKNIELYIWDSISGMKPIVEKLNIQAAGERTYGYDNYIDSNKPLTVSYIGGSITQQRQYTTPLSDKLDSIFKKDNAKRQISYSVQGLGGTNSKLGLYRLEKDVMAKKPDLVFIEFAVNDTDSSSQSRIESMECIIRKLMNAEHQPMICLLDLTTDGYASFDVIKDWEPLMAKYGIGYVNVGEYIKANEATGLNPDGLFVWRESALTEYPNATAITASDGVHPSAAGGNIYANYIFDTISANPGNFFKKMTVSDEKVSDFNYNNPRMISWDEAVYNDGWTKQDSMNWTFYKGVAKANRAGATLTFKFTGSTIGLFVPKSKTGTTASYSIDGGVYTGKVSCNANVSTDMPMMSMIKDDLNSGEHTITLVVDDAGDVNFSFGYFVVD